MIDADPWATIRTYHGLPADQVISALQKEIRRAHVDNAALLAYELMITSNALEDYLWQRLLVISVEDIGLGQHGAPVLVQALHQMARALDRSSERQLFALHAVRFLCACPKDRSSDEMLAWLTRAVAAGDAEPQIPDYAIDMHTAAGRALGRGARHFYDQGTQIVPELPGRDTKYRERLLALLDREAGG